MSQPIINHEQYREIKKVKSFPFVKSVGVGAADGLFIVVELRDYIVKILPDRPCLAIPTNIFSANAVLNKFQSYIVDYLKESYEATDVMLRLARKIP